MSWTEDRAKRRARAQIVDEEFKKLEEFNVDRRRIMIVDDDYQRSGGYGIVRQAELHHSAYLPAWLATRQYGPPRLVALKQIKISAADNMLDLKRAFTKEMLVWSQLKAHPGIAEFLGFYADFKRPEAWLLSPWEPNGNISEFVRSHNLEVPEKLSLVYDTADALAFLHQLDPPVCHGDIKSANVLVSADFRARLCDFGLARLHEDSGFGRLETSTGFKGSIRWCSPEILNGAPRAPTSDVYSWAWLVWEIMTGKLPYEDTSVDFVIMRQIFESPLPQVDGQSRLSDCLQVWELMTRCWNGDPLQRPTARMCRTAVTYLPRCTPTPGNADHQTRSAALLENLGDLESWKGNPENSSAYLDEALRLYREEADTKGIASVLRKQAVAAYRISDYVKVRAIATTALEHCRSLNDGPGIAEAAFYLGDSIWMLDASDEGATLLRESLEIRRTLGDDVGTVQCLERLADCERWKGQRLDALSTLDEAVAVASRSGDRLGLANALHAIGYTCTQLHDFAKAAEALSDAITITRSIGWEGGLSVTLNSMGGLKMRLEDYQAAEELFQESVSIARRIRDRFTVAGGLEGLGECCRSRSNPNEAIPLLEEACLLWHEVSQPEPSKRVASILVELKSNQGDKDGALFWLDHNIAVCRSLKEQLGVANHVEEKAEILVKAQRYDEAALHFEAAILTLKDNGYLWRSKLWRLCAIPKTVMKWERRLPLLCDLKKLQRRQPQLKTATLKLPISFNSGGP
ncbi:hypothetical protein M407DRAFT_23112 [Tulasnella calospora MUT 4182]|uniref:Protein kinase domain-containing protein n=1 Tax=Tulasnella calospora MUT 4182 TaxID=1051891 RepID=A0A0C3L1R1_9AGAM|nr:hypothetical protein M407DRAFT_23112 [Tulasnella calospora MUT 4182]